MATTEPVLSEWNEARRLAGKNFTCMRCSQRWNELDLREQDGLRVCVHCFEVNGGEDDRQLARAAGAALAAQLTAKEARPPLYPGWADGALTPVIYDFSVRPLRLTRGGASQVLTLTGSGFQSTDTITYGGSGITNAVAPVIASTSIVLTVQASGGATLGLQTLTVAGDTYRNVFDVRD
jgi:hypothetical protein